MFLRSFAGGVAFPLILAVGSCSTGPSAECELRLTGGAQLSTFCAPVIFAASGGSSVYGDTVSGPPTVALQVTAALAPTTLGWGQDDGDSYSLSVRDSTASWVVAGADFNLQFTDVRRIRVAGDTTFLATHGLLTATLIPDTTTTAKDTVMLRMTF